MRHAAIAIAVLALGSSADAKPKKNPKAEARRHVDAGTKAHKAGQFDTALTELQAAYELDPQPKLLFAIAQVQVKLDRCADAVPNYEKFLASTKDTQKQAIVRQAIEACNAKVAAPAPEPAPEPAPPPPAPVEPTPPAPVEPTPPVAEPPAALPPTTAPHLDVVSTTGRNGAPWYRDVLGDTLVLGGVAAGAVSLVLYAGARSSLDDAEDATTLPAYQDAVDDAKTKRNISVVLAGGSVVLIGAGLARYALRRHAEPRGVTIAPARGGGFITWTGGF